MSHILLTVVPPWLAAIGMSASSLVVVLNARRLAAMKGTGDEHPLRTS